MHNQSIFFDPTARRWRRIKLLAAAGTLLAIILGSVFAVSLWHIPALPTLPQLAGSIGRIVPRLPNRQRQLRQALAVRTERQLRHEIARERVTHIASRDVVAAFYAPWQTTGLNSLEANAAHLTHLMPAWLRLSRNGGNVDYTDWNPTVVPNNLKVIEIARQFGVAVYPVFSNAQDGVFDATRAHALLTDAAAQERVAGEIASFLVANHLQGINVDFENLQRDDYPRLQIFLLLLRATLAPQHLAVSIDVEPAVQALDWRIVSDRADLVLVMAYNEHAGYSAPGPISSMPFYQRALARAIAEIDRSKLVMGLANYGYDWREAGDGSAVSYQQALFTAEATRGENRGDQELVDFDPAALNPTFNYVDTEGQTHEVWLLDGVTAANQWSLAQRAGVRGAALWALGLEDPSIWRFISRESLHQPIEMTKLSHVSYPYAVEYMGEGEILTVVAKPRAGERALDVDPATKLCLDESYVSMPAPIVLRRQGYVAKAVALTIDDGPSGEFTPAILDVLKKNNVKATFFMIGENAQRYPELVRRVFREGHEIGNHTFTHANLAEVSDSRARLELNATQRVIQSLIGRSTTLFRPPYNADAEPRTVEEVKPVVLASQLGYVTVNEFIDPLDWVLKVQLPNGEVRNRTPEELARNILDRVHAGHGNDVLLHDAGGDRTNTVKALQIVIPELKREGYTFITASQLAGMSRDTVMPPVGKAETYLLGDDRVVFETIFAGELALAIIFIAAIILGVGRVFLMTALALIARRREMHRPSTDDVYEPLVSVLIAAYNEEKVIARTIAGVLRSDYPRLEVIVVDDGSHDATAEVVEREFGTLPNVQLIRQENGGKASALNRAITAASGDVFVGLDADTIFEPETIRGLVARFSDARVGAVAGNVKVGNRINVATRWQSIEYISSQNLDRRAYSLLNCVTVVPGAVGAWRREAVLAAGGYSSDTMAEDMDLTWRVRMLGWRVDVNNDAVARTEAPDNMKALFKQRFRWAYGTLQCLWKHRRATGKHGFFGRFMLPSLWLFQIFFQLISPIVDLQILYTVGALFAGLLTNGMVKGMWVFDDASVLSLQRLGLMYLIFALVEMSGAFVAFRLDGEKKRDLLWLSVQRFFYRQLMYAVVWKSLKTALHGIRAGWGKLDRKATVLLPEPAAVAES